MNDDGKPDFDKIDDAKNGYLKIWGGWPTCGCNCSSTVGAFKNEQGQYVLLQSDESNCNWEKRISSNVDLKDVLPPGFGINSFAPRQPVEEIGHAAFFLGIDIPRVGTDVKVSIELVPLGLTPEGIEMLCYEYTEKEQYSNAISISGLRDIAKGSQDANTLDLLLSGDFQKISNADNEVINKAIGTDDSRFQSKQEIRSHLNKSKQVYDVYMSLAYGGLLLGWDRKASRFYIKEQGGSPKRMSFKEFLITSEYWGPRC
tara:strand:+ start:785 stop:1558 length:774 start_codon:yes stop_codon:yes gene_type:complete